jgi:hypothetical protein
VKQDGRVLKHIPDNMKTGEVIMTAVSQCGLSLQYVPKKLRTKEVVWAAVTQNGWAYKYVPSSLRSKELDAKANETRWKYRMTHKQYLQIGREKINSVCSSL